MLERITDFSSSKRGKWIVLVLWLVIAGAIIPLSPTFEDVTSNDTLDFLPESAESTTAAQIARDRFPTDSTPAIIVLQNQNGLSEQDLANAQMISDEISAMAEEPESNVAGVVSIFTVPQAEAELVSADDTTMTMVVAITGSSNEEPYIDRIEAIREVTQPFSTGDLQVKVSGPGGLIADLVAVFANIDGFLLIVTAVLVLVLLILIYRSPVVAIVPLLIVGLVFQLANGVGASVLQAIDLTTNGQATGITTVILFGAGTDYILFISSRFREELVKTADKHEAMKRTMRGVGEAIASAGGTLMVAAAILLVADLGSYRALGPVIAIAIGIMILAGLTLVPAVLAILGRFSFWPFRPRYNPDAPSEQKYSPIWTRVARLVLNRPATVLLTTSAAMLLLTAGMLKFDPSYDSLESLPSSEESVQGFELLRSAFPPGELSPTSVYVLLPNGESVFDPENLQTISAISAALIDLDEVAQVTGPANPFGMEAQVGPRQIEEAYNQVPPELREQINAGRGQGQAPGGPPGEVDPDSPEAQAVGLYTASLGFVSSDLSIAEIEVVLNENPYSNAAMDAMPILRQTARAAASGSDLGPEAVLVGGETAQNYDVRAANNRDTIVVLPLVLLAIMVILGLLLRSVVAALYLGGTIILTYFGTLGLSILVFEYVFGQDSLSSSLPFLLFIFLNALGVDYSIYLMARIREEAKEFELKVATERALARTGGVITSAGLILAGTFAALMTLPLRDLFQLGFAVAIGVLIDTFITRSLLVPSIVELLGKWNWWPSHPAEGTRTDAIGEKPALAETD